MEKFLTVPQVCEMLQVRPALVYKWVHYGFVPHIKLGTKVRFRITALEKWIKKKGEVGQGQIYREYKM